MESFLGFYFLLTSRLIRKIQIIYAMYHDLEACGQDESRTTLPCCPNAVSSSLSLSDLIMQRFHTRILRKKTSETFGSYLRKKETEETVEAG